MGKYLRRFCFIDQFTNPPTIRLAKYRYLATFFIAATLNIKVTAPNEKASIMSL